MPGIMYGYARVSTRSQREDRQVAALREFGVALEHIEQVVSVHLIPAVRQLGKIRVPEQLQPAQYAGMNALVSVQVLQRIVNHKNLPFL